MHISLLKARFKILMSTLVDCKYIILDKYGYKAYVYKSIIIILLRMSQNTILPFISNVKTNK